MDVASGLDRFFEITKRGSNISTEVKGGILVFLSMAYIISVNTGMMATSGMDENRKTAREATKHDKEKDGEDVLFHCCSPPSDTTKIFVSGALSLPSDTAETLTTYSPSAVTHSSR